MSENTWKPTPELLMWFDCVENRSAPYVPIPGRVPSDKERMQLLEIRDAIYEARGWGCYTSKMTRVKWGA